MRRLLLVFIYCRNVEAQEWRLAEPHKSICYGEKLSVIWGNGFDGKIENAINIRDELLKLPWKDAYVFLSPKEHQWGTNELCVTLARLGQQSSDGPPVETNSQSIS